MAEVDKEKEKLKQKTQEYEKMKQDLQEQLEGYRREIIWKEKEYENDKQAYEIERDRLKAEIKLAME